MLFKFLDEKGRAMHGGKGNWHLPEGSKPGKWMPERDPVMCRSGYHGCERKHVLQWIGPRMFVMEVRGTVIREEIKVCAAEARLTREFRRWNERTQRLFAADCVERALLSERRAGREPHADSWKAIEVSRLYARGKATKEELIAAYSAASIAADSAASAANIVARAANIAARAANIVADSAASAANIAAGAANMAAYSAARAKERAWQTKRLFEYLEGKRR